MLPLNIAHRGGAGLRPENTLSAFAHAMALGADGAELDVQLTRDREVVVLHDNRPSADLCRDAQGHWLEAPGAPVYELAYSELETYDVGRPRPASSYARAHSCLVAADGERVPKLCEVVALAKRAPRRFVLFVELKTSHAERSLTASPQELAEATLEVLRNSDYLDRAVLVGFDWPGLLHAKKIEPRVACWFTTLPRSWFGDHRPPDEDEPPADPALQVLRHWARTGTSPWAGGFDAIRCGSSIRKAIKAAGGDGWFAFHRDIETQSAAEARALGLKIGAWTVNVPGAMKRLADIDALCTDRPDLFPAAFEGGR